MTTMTCGGGASSGGENSARVWRHDGNVVRSEDGKSDQHAVGGFQPHAVEDVAAAGDGVDALNVAGEPLAAEGVEVLLERGDEVGLPPAIAVNEHGGLRREEEPAKGQGEPAQAIVRPSIARMWRRRAP